MVGLEVKQEAAVRNTNACAALLTFPVAILWMEAIVKIWNFNALWNRGLLYTLLFSAAYGLLLSLVCAAVSPARGRIVATVLLAGLTVLYAVQAVYFTVMRTVPAVYSASVASDATEFWKVGLRGVWRTFPAILLLAVPLVLFLLFARRFAPPQPLGRRQVVAVLLAAVLLYTAGVGSIFLSRQGILEPWTLYHEQNNPELNVANFGVLTAMRLDVKRMLLSDARAQKPREPAPPPAAPESEESACKANVMDIDLAALAEAETDDTLRALHQYFAGREPTAQNEYTGLFAGKNLIMITAEAFNSWAIDPERTPTLYRLSQEGFVSENFYTPLWWVSTSDGEYVTCTSLLPKSGEQSFGVSAENSLYFSLGNQFRRLDYATNAYHNHTYTYYQRDKTHTNMGYDFKGVGKGLDISPLWPESDQEMMAASLPDYLGNAPFHSYYMTVSGHLQYFYDENDMVQKHWDKVKDLDLSEEAKGYLACQAELESALTYLLSELEAAGELENTVICLYGDHYPYGMEESTIEELGGPGLQGTAELYRSTLILWSAGMEAPVRIEKPCSNLDILPTLSNLFGLEYDSRLLMGRDILSTAPGLVIFSDYSYITDEGSYNAQEDVFTPNPGSRPTEDYPRTILQTVQDAFRYSAMVLENDYYAKIGLTTP